MIEIIALILFYILVGARVADCFAIKSVGVTVRFILFFPVHLLSYVFRK